MLTRSMARMPAHGRAVRQAGSGRLSRASPACCALAPARPARPRARPSGRSSRTIPTSCGRRRRRASDARRDQRARRRHAAGRGQVGRGRAQPRRPQTARSSTPPIPPRTRASGPTTSWSSARRAQGLRIMITITGDAPRWATAGDRGGNYKPNPVEYGRFVARGRQALLGRLRRPPEGRATSRSGTSRTTSTSSSRRSQAPRRLPPARRCRRSRRCAQRPRPRRRSSSAS